MTRRIRASAVRVMVLALAVTGGGYGPADKHLDLFRLFNTGCVVAGSPANGCVLTNVSGPVAPGADGSGVAEGRACGWNVLMLFAWGDLRIETAMRNGDIRDVTSVGSETLSILPGFYGITRHCTVVTGR